MDLEVCFMAVAWPVVLKGLRTRASLHPGEYVLATDDMQGKLDKMVVVTYDRIGNSKLESYNNCLFLYTYVEFLFWFTDSPDM